MVLLPLIALDQDLDVVRDRTTILARQLLDAAFGRGLKREPQMQVCSRHWTRLNLLSVSVHKN
jgi:hypothetical protein